MSGSVSSGSGTGRSVVAIVVAVLVGAAAAVAGSAGGLRVGGWPVFALCVAVAYLVNWVAFVPAWLLRTERFFDLTGALTYLTVVVIALVAGSRSSVAVVLGVLVAVWALRLGRFLVRRVRRQGTDRRFDQIKADPARFLVTWTLQALWVVLTAGAALAAMTSPSVARFGLIGVVGVMVWLVGFGIEVVADDQKRAFRADPANRGRFITTGLWAWSRHPNYFGEITLWVGVALVAMPALSGWQYLTLVSPLFVALLLTRVSGVPLLEVRGKATWGDDPEYRDYVARTPVLVLRPPPAVSSGGPQRRRVVSITGLLFAVVLWTVLYLPVVVLLVLVDLVRGRVRLPLARLVSFGLCWAWLESVGVAAALGLWMTGQAGGGSPRPLPPPALVDRSAHGVAAGHLRGHQPRRGGRGPASGAGRAAGGSRQSGRLAAHRVGRDSAPTPATSRVQARTPGRPVSGHRGQPAAGLLPGPAGRGLRAGTGPDR